ncbi:MAG: (2Fe-2S)-binding protein [Alphaproteobacteria bacterium]|nr:(2Fe-2S)-binding protein [Alphaproteobacteria bacterium]
MYVCICNALNTGAVNKAIDDGASTVAQVYKACGAAPQCGKCKCAIREMLDDRTPLKVSGQPVAGALPGTPADPLRVAVRAA